MGIEFDRVIADRVKEDPRSRFLGEGLDTLMGGPIELDERGNFNLFLLNSELAQRGLGLEIKYFREENRYAFTLYEVNPPSP